MVPRPPISFVFTVALAAFVASVAAQRRDAFVLSRDHPAIAYSTGAVDNPIARLDYAISTSLCTPTSLAQPGAHGLGTSGGPTQRLRLLTDAGFIAARVAVDTGHNLVLTATKPA